jgi:hypothetical protein
MPHIAIISRNQSVVHKLIGGGVSEQVMGREIHVHNIGVGPALNVTVTDTLLPTTLYFATLPTAIAVGEEVLAVRGTDDSVQLKLELGTDDSVQLKLELGTDDSVQLKLELSYEDVFHRKYMSTYDVDFNRDVKYTWLRVNTA